MINAQKIKEKIINNPEKIETILENLGCEHIQDKGSYYTSTRPGGDNRHSVVVYKDTLISAIYTLGHENIDIIEIVSILKGLYFIYALKWICDICDIDFYLKEELNNKSDFLKWLERTEPSNFTKREIVIEPLNENILNQYIKLPHYQFYKDGISTKTQNEFEIGFDLTSERITIPIRDEIGSLVGVKGRATIEDNGDFNTKYIYLYPCSKTYILYGLYKTYSSIKAENEVIVFESEKSVMLAWQYGYKNAIALGGKLGIGNTLGKTQEEKLVKLNVPITFAFDKDVDTQYIRKVIKHFKNMFCQVNLIYDNWGVLKNKEAPVDLGKKTFDYLYERKFVL